MRADVALQEKARLHHSTSSGPAEDGNDGPCRFNNIAVNLRRQSESWKNGGVSPKDGHDALESGPDCDINGQTNNLRSTPVRKAISTLCFRAKSVRPQETPDVPRVTPVEEFACPESTQEEAAMATIKRNHQSQQTTSHVTKLSALQCLSIIELGSRGAAGNFDSRVMSKLLTMGLVEVSSLDRRLVLTESGQKVYRELLTIDGP